MTDQNIVRYFGKFLPKYGHNSSNALIEILDVVVLPDGSEGILHRYIGDAQTRSILRVAPLAEFLNNFKAFDYKRRRQFNWLTPNADGSLNGVLFVKGNTGRDTRTLNSLYSDRRIVGGVCRDVVSGEGLIRLIANVPDIPDLRVQQSGLDTGFLIRQHFTNRPLTFQVIGKCVHGHRRMFLIKLTCLSQSK